MNLKTNNSNRRKRACAAFVAFASCLAFAMAPSLAYAHNQGGGRGNGGKQQRPMKFVVGPITQIPDGQQGKNGGGKGGNRPTDGNQGPQHP